MTKKQENIVNRDTIFLGFAYKTKFDSGRRTVSFRWGRIFLFMLILFCLLWGAKSIGGYIYLKNVKDFSSVTFADTLLFPANYKGLKAKYGEYFIEEGIKKLEEEEFRDAYFYLRKGVGIQPKNLKGRYELAKLYSPDQSIQLISEGIQYAIIEDEDYVRQFISLQNSVSGYEEILTQCNRLLETADKDTSFSKFLAFSSAQTYAQIGEYDQSIELLKEYKLLDNPDGIILQANIAWLRSEKQLAIKILEDYISNKPGFNYPHFFSLLSNYHMGVENFDKALRYAFINLSANSTNFSTKSTILSIYEKMGKYNEQYAAIEDYIRSHKSNRQAMAILASFAAENGKAKLAQRIYNIALEEGFELGIFSLNLIHANINAGQYATASEYCDEIVDESPAWLGYLGQSFNALRAIAFYKEANIEYGDLYFQKLQENNKQSRSSGIQLSSLFKKQKLYTQARELLEIELLSNSKNQQVLTNLITLNIETGNSYGLSEQIMQLLELRQPSKELAQQVHDALASDLFIFTDDRSRIMENLSSIINE